MGSAVQIGAYTAGLVGQFDGDVRVDRLGSPVCKPGLGDVRFPTPSESAESHRGGPTGRHGFWLFAVSARVTAHSNKAGMFFRIKGRDSETLSTHKDCDEG